MIRLREGTKFEGSVDFGKSFKFAVFAHILDDEECGKVIGGQRVANFRKKKFAKKCRDQVNKIDPRYEAHVVKISLSKRIMLRFYAARRRLREFQFIKNGGGNGR